MDTKQTKISTDFKVILTIYEKTELKNTNVDFTTLKQITQIDDKSLSKIIDVLYDRMMIDIKPAKIDDKHQSMCYFVSSNFLPFTKGLYNSLNNNQNQKLNLQTKLNKSSKTKSNAKTNKCFEL